MSTPTTPASSCPGPDRLPVLVRAGLVLVCLGTAGATAWQALPRAGERPVELGWLPWAGPALAGLGALAAAFGHRAARSHADRWWLFAAVVVLIAGAATSAGIVGAMKAPLETRGGP